MSVGSQLKKAREKKKVTLEEVYQQTRIHTSILSALEEDNFDQIKDPVYIKSFLRTYASYLKIDQKALIDDYNRSTTGLKEAAPEAPAAGEAAEKSGPEAGQPKKHAAAEPAIDRTQIQRMVKIAVVSVLVVFAVIFAAKGAALLFNFVKKYSEERDTKLNLDRKKALKNAIVEAKKADKVISEKIAESKKAKVEPAVLVPKVLVPEGQKLKLTVKVSDDTWFQLKADDKVVFTRVLPKGSQETWEADENFLLWTGNGSAMQLSLNNNELGSPGMGVIKDVKITRIGIEKQ